MKYIILPLLSIFFIACSNDSDDNLVKPIIEYDNSQIIKTNSIVTEKNIKTHINETKLVSSADKLINKVETEMIENLKKEDLKQNIKQPSKEKQKSATTLISSASSVADLKDINKWFKNNFLKQMNISYVRELKAREKGLKRYLNQDKDIFCGDTRGTRYTAFTKLNDDNPIITYNNENIYIQDKTLNRTFHILNCYMDNRKIPNANYLRQRGIQIPLNKN